jgi:Tol biopolymer transport system component
MPDVREVYEMITKPKQPEPGALERQQKRQVRAARNKKLGAFAVAAAIAVAAVVLILETRGGRDTGTPAHQPTTAAPGTISGPFFLDLRTGEKTALAKSLAGGYSYAASPDGTRIAFSSSDGGGCVAADGITVANIDGTVVRTLKSLAGLSYCAPRWSPDGTKIVYQERDGAVDDSIGNLFVQEVSSGRRTQVTDLKLSRAWWWFLSPSFSRDGRNVIFHLPRSSSETTKWDVWSAPVNEFVADSGEPPCCAGPGKPTLVLREAQFPVYFPDGKRIAFVQPDLSSLGGPSLQTIADASTPRRTLEEAKSSIWWPTMSPDGSRIAYQDGGSIYVLDVGTRQSSKVAEGNTAEWLDEDTLIVAP